MNVTDTESVTERLRTHEPRGANTPELLENFHSKKVIFYIEKSTNRNCVVYEVNLTKTGELASKAPVKSYWIMYETKPVSEVSLNFIELNTAYGYSVKPNVFKDNCYSLKIVSYSKEISIYIDKDGKVHAEVEENGQFFELISIYVKVKYRFGIPGVEYIDVKLKNDKQELITRRIAND